MQNGVRYNFEKLYIDNQPRLVAYALRFVKNPDEAEDLVHDCFIALWERHATLEPQQARMMLFVMTRNRCLNYLKHKNIIDKYAISIQAAVPSGEERLYNFDFNFDEGDTPYLHQDLEKQIKQLLDLLPDRCREVFILSRFNGLKNREIAEELHVSLHAVERHIQRALRIFSEALSHEKSGCLRSLLLACLIQLTS